MDSVFWIIITPSVLLQLFLAYMLVRNNRVYRYRGRLIDTLYAEAEKDVERGDEWEWRREYFHSVSYDEMVWKFWKPLGSFYQDKSFMRPGRKK